MNRRTWVKIVCALLFVALIGVGIATVLRADNLLHEQIGEDTESISSMVNVFLFELGTDALLIMDGKSPSALFYLEVLFVLLFIAFCAVFGWLLKNKAAVLLTERKLP